MTKKGKIYIVLTVIAILSIIVLEYTKPKDINWFPSYVKHHKIPFGTIVFYEQLERLFTNNGIVDIEQPPYEHLKQNPDIKGTYVFINNQIKFGKVELESLLEWTKKGNTLFIASEEIDETLLDTLNLKKSTLSNFNNINNIYQVQLKHKDLKKDSLFSFDKANFLSYFKDIDTLNSSIISVVDNYSDSTHLKKERVNTIKHSFGDGQIILSTFPQAFTNYFILTEPNQDFTSGLISYLDPSHPIYIDSHYKSGKTFYSSPLYILLNTKELKWAYYMMLIGAFIYVIFEGKRKQRAIPIVKPLRNQTIDFTRTIANMYYEKGMHKEMALHKIQHFLDFIRTHFHLNTMTINDEFIKNLASRSNNTIEDTKKLFALIDSVKHKTELNNLELERLNGLIETFKSNNIWKIKT